MTTSQGFWTTPFAGRLYIAVTSAGGMQKVASLSGVNERLLYEWLTTYQKPSLSKVERLARACAVNMAWLANADGPMTGRADVGSPLQQIFKALDAKGDRVSELLAKLAWPAGLTDKQRVSAVDELVTIYRGFFAAFRRLARREAPQ